jgi:glycosyltransferase involved in cell wall biosynthesis
VELASLNKADGMSLQALRDLSAYIKAQQIEVVHTHNPLVHHYGAAAARLTRIRSVVNTVHGINTLEMPRWAAALYGVSCRLTDHVVCVCQAVRDAVCSRLPAFNRTSIIYNGISLDDFLRGERRPRDGKFVFGTAGRLVAVKDHQSLVHAFADVLRRHPECRLEILGGGELQSQLEALVGELNLQNEVRFHGFREEVSDFLSGLDAFVLPSLSEGLPLTLLEAMASGLPIVASAVGGIVEVVENADCGWLCPPGRPAALADVMVRAIGDADLVSRGLRGRQSVIERYSLPVMVNQYERLFDQLLST